MIRHVKMTRAQRRVWRRKATAGLCCMIMALSGGLPSGMSQAITGNYRVIAGAAVKDENTVTIDVSTITIDAESQKAVYHITENGTYCLTGSNLRNGVRVTTQIVVDEGVEAELILEGLDLCNKDGYAGASTTDGTDNHVDGTCPLEIYGDASITVLEDSTIEAYYRAGGAVIVADGATLSIEESTAQLVAGGTGLSTAGIAVAGLFTMNGGNLTATGGDAAAGIGSSNGIGNGNVIIKDGTITATGGGSAAGIGADLNSPCFGSIFILGGNVTATGGDRAAGIGAGGERSVDDIVISGGIVHATGGAKAPGIGGGNAEGTSYCESTQITGGNVTSKAGDISAGLGAGYWTRISGKNNVNVSGGTVQVLNDSGALGKIGCYKEGNTGLDSVVCGGNISATIAGSASFTDGTNDLRRSAYQLVLNDAVDALPIYGLTAYVKDGAEQITNTYHYRTNDMQTSQDKLSVFLPEGVTDIEVLTKNASYSGKVDANGTVSGDAYVLSSQAAPVAVSFTDKTSGSLLWTGYADTQGHVELPSGDAEYDYSYFVGGSSFGGEGVTSDTSVQVERTKHSYTVTYTGDYTGTDSAEYLDAVTLPTISTAIYHFTDENGRKFTGQAIHEDTTVTVVKKNLITFKDSDTGEVIKTQEVSDNEVPTLPVDDKQYHIVSITDADSEEDFNGTGVTSNRTILVKRELQKYTVTYAGEVSDSVSVEYGKTVDYPEPTAGVNWIYVDKDGLEREESKTVEGNETVYVLKGIKENGNVYMTLGSVSELQRFRDLVNSGVGYLKAKLTEDIDVTTDEPNWTPIGTESNPYKALFYGQGHTITYHITESNQTKGQGLFGYVISAKFFDLNTSGTINTDGQYAGGIVGMTNYTVFFDRCRSDMSITYTPGGEAYCGGIAGGNLGSWSNTYFDDCSFTGSLMTGSGTALTKQGGMLGWTLLKYGTSVKNCFVSATFDQTEGADGATFVPNVNSNRIMNSYYADKDGMIKNQGTPVSGEALIGGETAWKLNTKDSLGNLCINRGVWAQGAQGPVIADADNKPVYRVVANSLENETTTRYSTQDGTVQLPSDRPYRMTNGNLLFTDSTILQDMDVYEVSYDSNNIQISPASVYYTGSEVSPESITVSYDSTVLEKNTDYSLTFTNNIDVNNGSNPLTAPTITVTGIGKFAGCDEISKTFAIEYYPADDIVTAYNGSTTLKNYYNDDITVTADGFTLSKTIDGTYTDSITFPYAEDGETELSYYLKQNGTGYITDKQTKTTTFDKTAPDCNLVVGTIAMYQYSSVQEEPKRLHICDSTDTLILTAGDGLSDVYSAEYYVTSAAVTYTKEQLKTADIAWMPVNDTDTLGEYTIPLGSENQDNIVYCRVTDKAGNRTYVSTDILNRDTIAPEVEELSLSRSLTQPNHSITLSGAVKNANSIYYVLLPAGNEVPTAEQVVGTASSEAVYMRGFSIHNAGSGYLQGNVADEESALLHINETFEYLDPYTSYRLYLVAFDATVNAETSNYQPNVEFVSTEAFTTDKSIPVCMTAPTLHGVYGTNVENLIITGGAVSADGFQIGGQWSVSDSDKNEFPDVGSSKKYEVTFTPDDVSTESITVEALTVITPRSLTKDVEGKLFINDGISIGDVTGTWYFTNKTLRPVVGIAADNHVVISDSKAVISDSDIDVEYGTNLNPGSGTVLIIGKNNYTGSYMKDFTIQYYPTENVSLKVNGQTAASLPQNKVWNHDVVLTATGYTLSENKGVSFSDSITIPAVEGTAQAVVCAKQDETGYITTEQAVQVEFDLTAPQLSMDLNGYAGRSIDAPVADRHYQAKDASDAKLHVITSDNKNQDELKLAYFITENAVSLSKSQLAAQTAWKNVNTTVSGTALTADITIEKNKNQMVYIKSTDSAGNVSYLATDCLFADDEPADVSGFALLSDNTLTDHSAAVNFQVKEAVSYIYAVYPSDEALTEESVLTAVDESSTITGATIGIGSVTDADLAAGKNGSVTVQKTISNLDRNTAYQCMLIVYDDNCNVGDRIKTVYTSNIVTTMKTMPDEVKAPELTGTYGISTESLMISGGAVSAEGISLTGTWSLTDSRTADTPSVGSQTKYEMTFTPNDTDFASITAAAATVITPRSLTKTVEDKTLWNNGITISNLELIPVYTGKSIQPSVGTGMNDLMKLADSSADLKDSDLTISYGTNINAGTGSITISGKNNYTGTMTITFTINKGVPVIAKLPTAGTIVSGQALSDSALTSGEAVINAVTDADGQITGTKVSGTFNWKDAETKPALSDSNKTEYEVIFTPDDTANLEPITCKVKLAVICKHTGATEVRGRIEPTYEKDGYTGDTYCTECGEKIATGTVIPKLVATPTPTPSATPTPDVTTTPSATPVPDKPCGDANLDGELTIDDAQITLSAALRITELTGQAAVLSDVDKNGYIELNDANLLLKASLGIIKLEEK